MILRGFLAGSAFILVAAAAQATITQDVVVVDNSDGRPTDFDYYTWDLRHILSGRDDWTMSTIVAAIEADEIANVTFNPRTSSLRPPVMQGEYPPTWSQRYRNMVSTPLNWPNTIDDAESTLGTADVTSTDSLLKATWFDTSTVEDVRFTAFRMTLRQTRGMPALTLENTGDLVATFSGLYAARNSGGSLFPYEYAIYRVPEPGALALLALGGLAGFSALGRAVRRD